MASAFNAVWKVLNENGYLPPGVAIESPDWGLSSSIAVSRTELRIRDALLLAETKPPVSPRYLGIGAVELNRPENACLHAKTQARGYPRCLKPSNFSNIINFSGIRHSALLVIIALAGIIGHSQCRPHDPDFLSVPQIGIEGANYSQLGIVKAHEETLRAGVEARFIPSLQGDDPSHAPTFSFLLDSPLPPQNQAPAIGFHFPLRNDQANTKSFGNHSLPRERLTSSGLSIFSKRIPSRRVSFQPQVRRYSEIPPKDGKDATPIP
jgi:hypothetical protein